MIQFIVGIDANSTSIALVAQAIGDKGPLGVRTTRKYDLMERSGPDACMWAMRVMKRWCISLPLDADEYHAYIEAPVVAGARNIQTTIKQSYVNGVVQAVLRDAGFEVTTPAPTEWKKKVIGKSHANKEEIAQWLHNNHPSLHRLCQADQDLVDATGVHLFGVAKVRGPTWLAR